MKRITSNSVTEALMSVMEEAGDLDQVVILYRRSGSVKGEKARYGFADNGMEIGDTNFLIDMFKGWLFSRFQEKDDE